MPEQPNYWAPNYWTRRTLSRRNALRTLGLTGGGLAALSLVGCGDDDDGGSTGSTSSTSASSTPSASTGATGTSGSTGGSGATGTTAIDSTKGKPGGKFVQQTSGFLSSIILVTGGAEGVASRTHSSLVQFAYGRKPPEGVSGLSLQMEPDLAEALPEQPDETTYIFKLLPANFHNGKPVTAEDVKYSIERSASTRRLATRASGFPGWTRLRCPTTRPSSSSPRRRTRTSSTLWRSTSG